MKKLLFLSLSLLLLACSKDDDELAKALLRIDIMIRPGATNSANDTPMTVGRAWPMATTKTSM